MRTKGLYVLLAICLLMPSQSTYARDTCNHSCKFNSGKLVCKGRGVVAQCGCTSTGQFTGSCIGPKQTVDAAHSLENPVFDVGFSEEQEEAFVHFQELLPSLGVAGRQVQSALALAQEAAKSGDSAAYASALAQTTAAVAASHHSIGNLLVLGTETTVATLERLDTLTWTEWLDRDNPSGVGDFETIADFVRAGMGCSPALDIECRVKGGADSSESGQVYQCDLNIGGICRNHDQPTGQGCLDYEIRLLCAGDGG